MARRPPAPHELPGGRPEGSWRSGGIGPEKTRAGLRGFALIALLVAFLGASNGFLSGGDEAGPTTGDPRREGRATVLAAEELRGLLTSAGPAGAVMIFASPASARERIEANEQADVFITTVPADADALAEASRCTAPLTVATKGRGSIVACLPTNVDADEALGIAYLRALTTLRARAALLDAGYDVPQTP